MLNHNMPNLANMPMPNMPNMPNMPYLGLDPNLLMPNLGQA